MALYLEFVTAESAQKALEMNGSMIDGRAIKVDLSLPRAPRENAPAKVFNDVLSGPPTTTLFVGNLPFSATEDAVWTAFADFGDVSSVRLTPTSFLVLFLFLLLFFPVSVLTIYYPPLGSTSHRSRIWPT